MNQTVKIMIVDDQPMIGEGLKQMLSFEKSFTITNFARDGSECLAKGLSDKGIASSLYISEHTSRTHIRNIYRKMGVSSRSQAVVKATSAGLINIF